MALDIEKYRKRLIEERDRLSKEMMTGDVAEIAEPVAAEPEVAAADAPSRDEAIDIQAAMVSMKSDRLEMLNAALQRIDEGIYGKCDVCGKEIDSKRLDAEPTATTDIEHARAAEADFKAPQM
jgi:RNA polymerase-binding transcription factor DksA